MCGISGEIHLGGQWVSPEGVQAMMNAMSSRGPDAAGLFQQNHRVFGHRRLSIIDLSTHAQQPMVDNQLGLGIVYNGAIYNYPELKEELQKKGYQFFSTGDTEVILKAYHAWGDEFVTHLQGMFAFAIWERDTEKVILARDRLGIKPLYYSQQGQRFRFASFLPSLVAAGDLDTSLDPVALHHYMSFHAVVPPPYTMLQGVRKLPPAHMLILNGKADPVMRPYWELQFPAENEDKSFADWQDELMQMMRTVVRRRLVADVSVGVLLSGGLDSSLIVGLLAEEGQVGLNTFSVGFEAVGGEKGDEFEYSDVIAQHFATTHHKIQVDAARMLPNMAHCVKAMSEPMVSHDNIGFYLLSQEVSKHVKVVQSGQGADEVFAGYYWYPPMMEAGASWETYRDHFFDREHSEFARAIHPDLVYSDYSSALIQNRFSQATATTPIDKALHNDITMMLVDDPVKRVDNMTMAWGLEARVPFLDHELVELAARIPAKYKVPHEGKYILREVGRKVIPAKVIDRPKGYFPVPALKYLQGEYLDFVKDILNQPAATSRKLFQKDYVDMLLSAPEQHITPLRGSKLWQVVLLEYWLQSHQL